jgi:hypothetical protein
VSFGAHAGLGRAPNTSVRANARQTTYPACLPDVVRAFGDAAGMLLAYLGGAGGPGAVDHEVDFQPCIQKKL